jgi:hypothetical protein
MRHALMWLHLHMRLLTHTYTRAQMGCINLLSLLVLFLTVWLCSLARALFHQKCEHREVYREAKKDFVELKAKIL